MGSKKFKNKIKNKKFGKVRKTQLNEENGFPGLIDCQSTDHFSEIREKYFNYLQNVIKENLEYVDNRNLYVKSLEKISLEVEQQALLACMQSDIYQKAMVNIIHDIRKSTHKMKLHFEIQNAISSNNLEVNEVIARLKKEIRNNDGAAAGEKELNQVYSHIPTISGTRTNYEYGLEWSTQNEGIHNYENGFIQSVASGESCEPQDFMVAPPPDEYVSIYSVCAPVELNSEYNNCTDKIDKLNVNGVVPESGNEVFCNQNFVTDKEHSEHDKVDSTRQNVNFNELVSDPISKSRDQLQRSVEMSLKNSKEISIRRKEERFRAQLTKILEDDDDGEDDENQYDSLSDNCDDRVEMDSRSENLLSDRLEEMRQIFGMEDDEEEVEPESEKVKEPPANDFSRTIHAKPVTRRKPQRHPHIWFHEKIIQMHRLSRLASEMTPEMRDRNRHFFHDLFGEDSDEENGFDYYSEEKYLTSCTERISSWVVKYLMPFYNKRRIIGRNVFKSLGHHISNSIIEQIQYPDEWTVKYFVTKFFPIDKRFVTESDVWWFRIE